MPRKVVRFSLFDFSATGVSVLNLVDVNTGLLGFWGGFTDGERGYLMPTENGKLVSFGLSNFTASEAKVLDLTKVDPDLTGFRGGFANAEYGFAIPYGSAQSPHGKLVRRRLEVRLRGPDAESTCGDCSSEGDGKQVDVLDLGKNSTDLRTFDGGFAVGDYGYLIPGSLSGKLVRFTLAFHTQQPRQDFGQCLKLTPPQVDKVRVLMQSGWKPQYRHPRDCR